MGWRGASLPSQCLCPAGRRDQIQRRRQRRAGRRALAPPRAWLGGGQLAQVVAVVLPERRAERPFDVLGGDRTRPGLSDAPEQLRPKVALVVVALCAPPRLQGWQGTPAATTSISPAHLVRSTRWTSPSSSGQLSPSSDGFAALGS